MKSVLILLTIITLGTPPLNADSSDDKVMTQQELEEHRQQVILWLQSEQVAKDMELALKMGSGEPVTININATEGLEGNIAQELREAIKRLPEKPKSLTFMQWIKSFF